MPPSKDDDAVLAVLWGMELGETEGAEDVETEEAGELGVEL